MSSSSPRNSPVNGGLVAVLLLLVGMLGYRLLQENTSLFGSSAVSRTVTPRGDLADDEKTTIEIFRNAAPSVVSVTTAQFVSDWQRGLLQVDSGQGSGIVWDKQGHIVTNYHVIADAIQNPDGSAKIGAARVTLADGTTWDAQVKSFLQESDLAVLKIKAPASRLTPLALGTSGDLEIGQNVFAIGNPFGLNHTLTRGIIGGLRRNVPSQRAGAVIEDMIQTDAAINPGNSGGPLLDSAGRMIGINTMIYSPSGAIAGVGQNSGVGFAVPIDSVNLIVPELITGRYGTRPGLGVGLATDEDIRRFQKQGLLGEDFRGAVVVQVAPGSAAFNAGLQPGDIIVGVDDQDVASEQALREILNSYHIGDEVTLRVRRDSTEKRVRVRLQSILDRASLQARP